MSRLLGLPPVPRYLDGQGEPQGDVVIDLIDRKNIHGCLAGLRVAEGGQIFDNAGLQRWRKPIGNR